MTIFEVIGKEICKKRDEFICSVKAGLKGSKSKNYDGKKQPKEDFGGSI